MRTRKILFVTYGGGHATMLLPIIEFFRKQRAERFSVEVLGLTLARPLFERHGIAALGFRDFVEPGDRAALELGRQLAAEMHSGHTGIDYDESVAYLGLSYRDLVDSHGEVEARRQFEQRGRQCFVPVATLQRVFNRLRPDVLVTTNAPRAERAARQVAKQRGIPVFSVTNLLGNSEINPLETDHLFAACSLAMDNYRAADKVVAGHLHLVGNPAMDLLLEYRDKPDPAWMAQRFPAWKSGAKYVVSAEQESYMRLVDDVFVPWSADELRRNLEALYHAARDNDAVLLIRPHPSLDPEPYANWVAQQPEGTAYMAATDPLHRLLCSSHLLVANNTTVMLEALYLRCPVLLVSYPDSKTYLEFDRLGYAFPAPLLAPDELAGTMRAALHDEARRQALQACFESDFPPPPCTPRIVDIIERELG